MQQHSKQALASWNTAQAHLSGMLPPAFPGMNSPEETCSATRTWLDMRDPPGAGGRGEGPSRRVAVGSAWTWRPTRFERGSIGLKRTREAWTAISLNKGRMVPQGRPKNDSKLLSSHLLWQPTHRAGS